MISGMSPHIQDHVWIYCRSSDPAAIATAAPLAFAVVREEEDVTLILEHRMAERLGFDTGMPMRQITLRIFSALDGCGLTAAFAPPLAKAGIACNVVAGFHHDHLFVPAERADEAMAILKRVQQDEGA
jgi:hypothetical protein